MRANLLSHGRGRLRHHRRRRRGDHREHRAPALAARPGTAARRRTCATASSARRREVVRPTVFSLLIIIAAYLPIFLLQRVEGRIFAPMANTVVAALLGALLFSVTLVPVLATLRLPQADRATASRRCCAGAQRALRADAALGAATRPRRAVARRRCCAARRAALALCRGSAREFLPELNEGALYVTFTLPSNISPRPRGARWCRASPSILQRAAAGRGGAVAARPARGRHRRRR